MKKDIFNIDDISDIPEELLSQLGKKVGGKRSSFSDQITSLFKEAGRDLTIDQVAVGYYRKYNKLISRKNILAKLYNMTKGDDAIIAKIGDDRPTRYKIKAAGVEG